MAEDTQMLNPRQVAEILGVHQKTVHIWLRSGRLPGIKISYRAWRIPRAALDDFITTNSNTRFSQQKSTVVPHQNSDKIQTTPQEQKPPANNEEVSTHSRMKHYIKDIMGEQIPEEK